MSSPLSLSFDEERQLREVAFKWTLAWDKKDLATFLSIAAPEVIADYTSLFPGGQAKRSDPKELFSWLFSERELGHPNLKTQHLLGAVMFKRIDEAKATGDWQTRASHVKKAQDGRTLVWDNTAYVEHTYVKLDDGWKLHAWRPHDVGCEIGSKEETIGAL